MVNFDEIIDRKHSNAMKMDGFRSYIFHADDSMKFPYADDEFIHMWVADMEFAVPDCIIEGVKERLNRKIFGYTQLTSDCYYAAFENWCRQRYDWTFDRNDLVTSNGIVPALYELVNYICKSDEKVMFLTPSYPYFMYAAQKSNLEHVCCNLINKDGYYTIDFDDFEKKASDEKVTVFILCNPSNPSGRVWREGELQRIADICQRYHVWVISDEIHCDLLRVGQRHIPMGKVMPDYDKLITCMAPSKTFNIAGLMFSNIIIRNNDLKKVWKENHYNFDNPLSIAAAQAAYEGGEEWLEQLRVYLDENFAFTKRYLNEHLPKAKFNIPEATYLAWVDLSSYFNPDENMEMFFAYKAGVLLESGSDFVQNGDGFIRLNLACPKVLLERGLQRICEAVNTKHTEKYYGGI